MSQAFATSAHLLQLVMAGQSRLFDNMDKFLYLSPVGCWAKGFWNLWASVRGE
jgi:hypothetical protein